MQLREDKPTLDYRGPATVGRSLRGWICATAGAFIGATAATCFLVFGISDWVRLARPGSRLYGPQDQYVSIGHAINAFMISAAMCLIGGAIYVGVLRVACHTPDSLDGRGWVPAMALGVWYCLFLAFVVAVGEQLAGTNIGGPTRGECAAYIAAIAVYPVVAAWVTGGFTRAR